MRPGEGKVASITWLVSGGFDSPCCPSVRLPWGKREGHLVGVFCLENFIQVAYFHIRTCEDLLTLLIQFTTKKCNFSKSDNSCVCSSLCLLGHLETQSTVVVAGR